MTTFSFAAVKNARPALGLLGLGLLGLGLLGLAGCQTNIDSAPTPSPGSLDFTSYVAVGNSLTAGYSDGGLYNEAQATSYPALLAQQFATTGKGPATFVQPAFSTARRDGSGYAKLQTVNGTLTPVQPSAANQFLGEQVAYTGGRLPLPTAVPPGSGAAELEAYAGAQPDNLGVPGISVLSADRTAGATANPVAAAFAGLYGNLNNFYQRLLPAADRSTKDYVTYIGQKNPTFFTCWMGNNDVLTYAINGAVVDATNPFSNLTDTTSFRRGYSNILRTISKNGTVKGAVANIPNVTGIPYFTTVTPAAVLASYQAAGAPIQAIFVQARTAAATTAIAARVATATDLLTLTTQAYIAANPGVGTSPNTAIPNQFVLDPFEQADITTRTNLLNGIISTYAGRFQVPVADMNTFFTSIAARGVVSNGVNNTATFASGNLFSLDGVHPTPRGYAIVANEWIRVINSYYGATIPNVDANVYRSVLFP